MKTSINKQLILLLSILFFSFLTTQIINAQNECVVFIQGAEKPASGKIQAENFARNTTDKMITAMGSLKNPTAQITVLRPTGATGSLPAGNPPRIEKQFADKSQLLKQLKSVLCNPQCDDVLIAIIGHGMEDTLSTDSIRRINGGLWLGQRGGRYDEFLMASEIAQAIDSCKANVKLYANHCFSQAMIDGVKHYLQDPSRLRIGIASSRYDEISDYKDVKEQFYDFSRYFLEDFYTLLTNPEALEKLRAKAEELKKDIEKENEQIELKRKEIEKKIKEKEAEIKKKEAEITAMEKTLQADKTKVDAAVEALNASISTIKSTLELLNKRIELIKEQKKIYENINNLKGRANSDARKEQYDLLRENKKAISENAKALRENKVSNPTSTSMKILEKRITKYQEELKKLQDEATKLKEGITQKEKEITKKKDELAKLKLELEALKKKLKETTLKKLRPPFFELLLSEAFKSAKDKTKSSHPQRNGDLGTNVSIPLPAKPFIRISYAEKKTNAAGKDEWAYGDYRFVYYKIEITENKKKKCHLVGWVADKHGMPVAPIKTDTCTIDCRITRFSFHDGTGHHQVSISTDARDRITITVDGKSYTPVIQSDRVPLNLPGTKALDAGINFKPGMDNPSVWVPGWKVTNVHYDPKTGILTFDCSKDGKTHKVKIKYGPHGKKEITIDNLPPYTEAMAFRSGLYDEQGLRIGELGFVNRNGSLSGTLWLEHDNLVAPVSGWYDENSTIFLGRTNSPAGGFLLAGGSERQYWSPGSGDYPLQTRLQSTPFIFNGRKSITHSDGKAKVRLSWEVDVSLLEQDEKKAFSGMRILRYGGFSMTPTVFDLPASASAFEDTEILPGMSYTYHVMAASEKLFVSECEEKNEGFPVYSYPEIIEVEKKELKRKDMPSVLEIAAGMLTTGGTIYYIRSLNDDEGNPAPPVAVDDLIEMNCYDEIIVNILDNDTGEDIKIVSIESLSGATIEQIDDSSVKISQPSLTSFVMNYTIADRVGQNATATIEVIVFFPDILAVDDYFSTEEGVALTGNVLTNDAGNNIELKTIETHPSATLTFQADGTFNLVPEAGFCEDLQLVYTLTDICGQEAKANIFLDIVDVTAPLWVTEPSDLTVNCDAIPEAIFPEATDNCGGVPTVTLNEEINGGSWPYTILRIWTAEDEAGNQTTVEQTLTVQDTVAPFFLSFPPDTLVDCDNIPIPAEPAIEDNCTDNPTFSLEEEVNGTSWPYQIIRTWTLTDEAGNSSSAVRVITVQDTTAPVLEGLPDDITVECADFPAPPLVTATDNCTETPPIGFTEEVVPGCPILVIRTWSAVDDAGNLISESRTVTIFDVTAPTIICPSDVTIQCGEPIDPVFLGTAVAADDCTPVNIIFTDIDLGPCPAEIIRVWTAVDECGNESTCEQIIDRIDPGCDFNPIVTVEDAICGLDNGIISIVPTEPGEYEYTWSNGATQPDINQLSPGTYTVSIYNVDLDCSQIVDVIVNQQQIPLIIIEEMPPLNGNDGSISLLVDNPDIMPPFDIYLNGFLGGQAQDNQFIIDGLGPGTYNIFIISSNGCISNTVSVVFVLLKDDDEEWKKESVFLPPSLLSGPAPHDIDLIDFTTKKALLGAMNQLGVEHPEIDDGKSTTLINPISGLQLQIEKNEVLFDAAISLWEQRKVYSGQHNGQIAPPKAWKANIHLTGIQMGVQLSKKHKLTDSGLSLLGGIGLNGWSTINAVAAVDMNGKNIELSESENNNFSFFTVESYVFGGLQFPVSKGINLQIACQFDNTSIFQQRKGWLRENLRLQLAAGFEF